MVCVCSGSINSRHEGPWCGKRKKEKSHQGGMGGRHAATTQGFHGCKEGVLLCVCIMEQITIYLYPTWVGSGSAKELVYGTTINSKEPSPLSEPSPTLAACAFWASPSASSYLSSQSLADSRCNLHATSRSSHSRCSLSCRSISSVSSLSSASFCGALQAWRAHSFCRACLL